MNQKRLIQCVSRAAILVLLCAGACGDDDTSNTDAGPGAGKSGGGGKGGAGGTGGRGGSGGAGGRSGTAGASVQAGTGAAMMLTCTEPAPTAPVMCGGQTCAAPTEFAMNPCVVPCCVNQGGKELCASKSTAMGLSTECGSNAVPDPACPNVDAMAMTFVGCCNAEQGKCGIISPLRPGCITQSMLITLPDPLQACTASAQDAGVGEGG